MATYEQIRDYVKQRHGYSPKNCWIAHVKEMSGLPLGVAPNRQDPARRVVPCHPGKVGDIREAFGHFGMLAPTTPKGAKGR